jgi:biopolymer transport protein ExbD
MDLKEAVQRRRHHNEDADIDLTAVMNIFLILIPFLLLTAVFVKIAILELSLPNLEKKSSTVQRQAEPKSVVLNFLFIRDDGFEFKSPEFKFSPIPKTNNTYNWQELIKQLEMAKTKYPDSKDIIIAPDNSIKYETIITVMDHCRESGFTQISISG